jgi:hypothetical protein
MELTPVANAFPDWQRAHHMRFEYTRRILISGSSAGTIELLGQDSSARLINARCGIKRQYGEKPQEGIHNEQQLRRYISTTTFRNVRLRFSNGKFFND